MVMVLRGFSPKKYIMVGLKPGMVLKFFINLPPAKAGGNSAGANL
jgi:hypothetical protein